MIIKRLTLKNFGVYAGINTFDFYSSKPVVLIGGMNGNGKTTFLDAILLALYGPNSAAYKESKIRSYDRYLISHINTDANPKKAYVELEFIDESTNTEYLIHRDWKEDGKEHLIAVKNGDTNTFLTENWTMFIENLLPSALSQFFFFDGEKIVKLATDETDDELKKSIRAMLGLNVLDTLKNDLRRERTEVANNNINSNLDSTELNDLKSEKENLENKVEAKESEIAELQGKLHALKKSVESLEVRYEQEGGNADKKRSELTQQKEKLTEEYHHLEAELIALSSTALPLAMVSDLLDTVKISAEDEKSAEQFRESYDIIRRFSREFISQHNDQADTISDFLNFIQDANQKNTDENIFNLSDQALYQVNDLEETGIRSLKSKASDILKRMHKIQKQLNDIESHLNLDINRPELHELLEEINSRRQLADNGEKNLEIASSELRSLKTKLADTESRYKKATEIYMQKLEKKNDADRKLSYIHKASKVISIYEKKLQEMKIGKLGETITDCYRRLANKKSLIDHIEVSPKTLQIRYIDSEGGIVRKDSLSAGENQLMVISILWALAICSSHKLPVIIDTPLARLDSHHRTALVQKYFPYASRQTIILSTDSEIGHKYYDMMKNFIGDEFILIYNEKTKSTKIKRGYFPNED